MPEPVLHVVPKYPQVEHIATQVHPAGMHEHGRKYRDDREDRVSCQAAWDERPLLDERFARRELEQEHDDADRDQSVGNDRCGVAVGVIIT